MNNENYLIELIDQYKQYNNHLKPMVFNIAKPDTDCKFYRCYLNGKHVCTDTLIENVLREVLRNFAPRVCFSDDYKAIVSELKKNGYKLENFYTGHFELGFKVSVIKTKNKD
jgi:hypothetical protein